MKCPLCGGTGKREMPAFSDHDKTVMRNCSVCKGRGTLPGADATTARRKAMAEAIRERMTEIFRRGAYNAATVPDELAEDADVAAEKAREERP